MGLLCSASRTSTGWAQWDVARGSGRERGGYFSGPEGVYTVTWTCRGEYPQHRPRYCADNLDEEEHLLQVS